MLHDPLANSLSLVQNAERISKKECIITPTSTVIKHVLRLFNELGYVGAFEDLSTERGGVIKLNLLSNINKCGVIRPRFAVKVNDFEKFEKRYLPAKGVGAILVSTSKGIMTLDNARSQNIGGRLLAYCY